MKRLIVLAFALVCSSSIAEATITTYTSSADFFAANPNVALIEDFDDSLPGTWVPDHLPTYTGPRGLITFTPIGGYPDPNVTIAQPGFDQFAADVIPLSSFVITTNGNEDFIGTLNIPALSLGFDILLNDSPGTLSFFNGDTLLATLIFDDPVVPADNRAFAGIFSSGGVTSFRWTATNGQRIDTGIDNIYAGPVHGSVPGVPEPSTWATMLLGFALIGALARRTRKLAQGVFKMRSSDGVDD
jgi:hypothetical protein